jgi:hypothetical protein
MTVAQAVRRAMFWMLTLNASAMVGTEMFGGAVFFGFAAAYALVRIAREP